MQTNKYIAYVMALLFVQMLATAIVTVAFKDFYCTIIGCVCITITLLVLYGMYCVRGSQIRAYNRRWKQAAYEDRERKIASDMLFLTYDYNTRDWSSEE